MIECPICRVMNEDMARFCAECGQRLSAPAPPAQAQAPQPRSGPAGDPQAKLGKAPGAKLHSPLLGGDLGTGETDEPKADYSRLRGGAGRGSGAGGGHDAGQGDRAGRPLRSPLLGGGEPEAYSEPEPTSARPKRGLKSPLLGGGADFQPEYDEPQAQRGGPARGLRSPLLGGSDADFDEPAPKSGRGLRSPLLGGEPEYDQPNQARSAGGGSASRPGGLRSPLLGGSDPYGGGFEPEPDQEDNPNVLRSPLLAAKVPMSERPAKPAGQPPPHPQMHQQGNQGPGPSVNEAMLDAFTGGHPQQPGQAGPGYTPGYAPAQPTPIQHAHGPAQPQPIPPMPAHVPPAPAQVQPIQVQMPQAPSQFAPGPASSAPTSTPIIGQQASLPSSPPQARGLSAGSQGMAASFSGGSAASPVEAQHASAPSPFDSAPATPQRYAQEPAPPGPFPTQPEPERPSVMIRSGRGKAPPPDSEPAAEEDARPRKRMSSRMIPSDEPEPYEQPASGGRFAAPPPQAAGNPIAKILIIPLVGALLEKGWIITQVGGNQLYLIDTVASMVVIACLIVLCATSGGGRR